MDPPARNDPDLLRFRDAVAELYGPTLDRVVLFGSRARGEAKADSDYDLAIFLNGPTDIWAEWGRLARLRSRFLLDGAPFFEAIPFPATAYADRTPIMHEIRKDGITL